MDDRVAKLLLKAVRALPPREQDQVLTALFREAVAGSAAFARPAASPGPPGVMFLRDPGPLQVGAPMEASGPSAMFPVRLPPELHERLRRWSTEKGFSMAGVVRGLVERFLDEQAGTKPPRRSAAAARPRKRPTARG
jgi:hypothetical protein